MGAGYAGVEALAEAHDLVRDSLRHYPRLKDVEQRWLLVDGGDRVLAQAPQRLGDYAARDLAMRGIDIRLGWAPTVEEIEAMAPEHVIVATGSAPSRDIIGNIAQGRWETPGLELEHVLDVWNVLEDGVPVGHKVLVADDGEGTWKAISLALDLAEQGHDVHLSTPLPYVGAKINFWSEYQQKPAALAARVLFKLPTGDKDVGVSTGKLDTAIDLIVSKEAAKLVDISGFGGYEWRGQPDGFEIPGSAFRWGAGLAFPSRNFLRVSGEINGFITSDDVVDVVHAADLSRKVARMRPIGVIKG